MKHTKFFSYFILLGLLTGCGEQGTSETVSQPSTSETPSENVSESLNPVVDLENLLNELRQGVKIETEGSETYKGQTQKLFFESASKSKEFSFVSYFDSERTREGIHEYYTNKENDDLVYSTRLDVSNQYHYYKISKNSDEFYRWDDGYDNVFLELSKKDFVMTAPNQYELVSSALMDLEDYFSTLFYGNPGLDFHTVTFDFSHPNSYQLNAQAFFGSDYIYEFSSVIVEKGSDTKMNYRLEPFEDVEDEVFEEMLLSLKANNYKAVIQNFVKGEEVDGSIFISNEDKISYITGYYDYGYYVTEDGLLQAVERQDGNYYKTGLPEEGDLNDWRAKFHLSRACFDLSESNHTYTLKKGVEGGLSCITLLEASADELDQFSITGDSTSGYIFTNINGNYKTIVTFTDIGRADVGFNQDSVLDPIPSTSWSELLSDGDYQALVDLIGEENASTIPVPQGYTSWAKDEHSTTDKVRLFTEYGETIEDDLFSYYAVLTEEIGFEYVDDTDSIIVKKAVSKDGVDTYLYVEMSIDAVNFYLDFYFGE